VFIILARKASHIGQRIVLAAWLYRTARYAAADVLRSEYRRQQRERQAIALESSGPEPEATWNQVAPRLDEALARLTEKDRSAILLRFFENKSLREVGRSQGIDEDAARKRVARAVAKLRLLLSKPETPLSVVALTGLLTSHAIHIAPIGLAVSATNAALAHGAGISASILGMVKATVNSMLWSKAKTILAVGGAAVLMLACVFFQKQNVPLPRSDQVAARHLAATRANQLRFDVRSQSAGRACMSCHDVNTRKTVLVRELGAKGIWKQPAQGWKGDFAICLAGPNRIVETIHADGLGEFVRGLDGKHGWCISPTSGAKLLSIGEVEELRRDADFLAWPQSEHWTRTVRSTDFAEKRLSR
jgi:RNA polymerase sigma factor (sigma-70 family)